MALIDYVSIYYSMERHNGDSNGGRCSNVEIPETEKNIFPAYTEDQRTNSVTLWRKIFLRLHSPDNNTLDNAFLAVISPSTGPDELLFFSGTHTDTQADISPARYYGAGSMAAASAGDTQIVVTAESASNIFQAGDLLYLQNDSQEQTDLHVQSVSWTGNTATITLDGQVTDDWPSGGKACSLPGTSSLKADKADVVVSSSNGTFDDTQLTVKNQGTDYDEWTITFTSSTEFTCEGVYSGTVGSGVISSDFSPLNSYRGDSYFTIAAAAWGGTFQAGDTVTFKTLPSEIAVWIESRVSAGTGTFKDSITVIGYNGEG